MAAVLLEHYTRICESYDVESEIRQSVSPNCIPDTFATQDYRILKAIGNDDVRTWFISDVRTRAIVG